LGGEKSQRGRREGGENVDIARNAKVNRNGFAGGNSKENPEKRDRVERNRLRVPQKEKMVPAQQSQTNGTGRNETSNSAKFPSVFPHG